MKNFLDIDDQIELNKELLKFYYSNYQRTQSKISVLVLIYSVIAIYLIQLLRYPFESFSDSSVIHNISYSILLLGLFIALFLSIQNTYQLLKPMQVAYLNKPKYFYSDIKELYVESLKTGDEETLNAYIKASYLNEMEEAVQSNFNLFEIKAKYYYSAFQYGLYSVLIYLLCAGFVIFKDESPSKYELSNYKEILKEFNLQNNPNKLNMSEDSKRPTQNTEKVKVDPSRVIRTQPVMINENFSSTEKIDVPKAIDNKSKKE